MAKILSFSHGKGRNSSLNETHQCPRFLEGKLLAFDRDIVHVSLSGDVVAVTTATCPWIDSKLPYFRRSSGSILFPCNVRMSYTCTVPTPFKPWISVNWRSLKGLILRVHFTLNSVASTQIQGLKGVGSPTVPLKVLSYFRKYFRTFVDIYSR